LGVDGKLLAAQIVNFIILVLILRHFVYKPLMAMLEKRRTDIADSLKKVEEIEQRSQAMQAEHEKQMAKSKEEALAIIDKAKQAAETMRAEMLDVTKAENEKLLVRAQEDIAREKDKMLGEAKQDIGKLVIAASEKILQKELDEKTQERFIDEALNGIK
jgi:F-type H+-transporting ATPase subunit b